MILVKDVLLRSEWMEEGDFYEVDRQARPGSEETLFNGFEESGNNGATKTRVVVHGKLGFGFVKS